MRGLSESDNKELKASGLELLKELKAASSPSIVVLEDDTMLAQQLVAILEKEGYSGLHYTDPLHLLQDIREIQIKALILDIKLPQMNGIEFLKRLDAVRKEKNFPVIVMTGDSQKATVEAVAKAKVNAFLVKPLSWEVLLKELKKYSVKTK